MTIDPRDLANLEEIRDRVKGEEASVQFNDRCYLILHGEIMKEHEGRCRQLKALDGGQIKIDDVRFSILRIDEGPWDKPYLLTLQPFNDPAASVQIGLEPKTVLRMVKSKQAHCVSVEPPSFAEQLCEIEDGHLYLNGRKYLICGEQLLPQKPGNVDFIVIDEDSGNSRFTDLAISKKLVQNMIETKRVRIQVNTNPDDLTLS